MIKRNNPLKRTPLKRSTNPIKRSPVVTRRTKPRPGRLEGNDLEALRLACWKRDKGLCHNCGKPTLLDIPHVYADSFHMAHVKGKRMHGDSLPQVRTECGACHRNYHNFGPSRLKPVPKK